MPIVQESFPRVIRSDKEESRKVLFDIDLNIISRAITKGELLRAVTRLVNVGDPGSVTALVEYWVQDASGSIIYSETKEVLVQTQEEFVHELDVGMLLPGRYTLKASLSYDGQKEPAYSQESFIVEMPKQYPKRLILIGLASFLGIFLIFAVHGSAAVQQSLRKRSVQKIRKRWNST